jgi:hypothetical protein
VDIEDERMAAHLRIENLLFDLYQLASGFLDGPKKSLYFITHLFRLNPFLRSPNFGTFDHEGFSRNDPRGSPDPLDKFVDLLLDGHP